MFYFAMERVLGQDIAELLKYVKYITGITMCGMCVYTGCNRRNEPDFGRVFLRSYYTDITQNTYIQSSMVTEILAREVLNFDSYY